MAVRTVGRTRPVSDPDVLWRPRSDARETARMGRYLTWLGETRSLSFDTYEDLWEWSVHDLEGFWSSIWEYFEVRAVTPYTAVLGNAAMPGAQWFPGATLNYAEHALRSTGSRVVVTSVSQTRPTVELSADQLRDQVARARAGLVRLGVRRGDRVAAYLPNIAEAVVAYLAAASLGAIWSSCAPEFGARTVIDRFRQIEPVVLLTVDGYRAGSTAVDRTADVAAIRAALPSLKATVVLPYLVDDPSRVPGATPWSELVSTPAALSFEPVPFDHPLHILYSSGTTGLPKPIVHGHGGILLELLKSLAFHHDLGEDDRFFWYSSTGWMMWNLLVGGLAVGAAIVCFDGSPAHPDLGALWQLAEETGVTYFGAGAPYFFACRRDGLNPGRSFNLSALRGVGSTASPLPAESFRWIHDAVGPVHIASMSGGTDVCTAIVGGSPLVPVRAGEISCRYLGARVEAYDAQGRAVVGEPGELVITAPMPSMPVAFWGDMDGSRLRETYFDDYPGVWSHGDWISITDTGACVISGRSDATLNRGGIRVGTAEVYAVVEDLVEISDSLVVHLEGESDGEPGELCLFVVPASGVKFDDPLRRRINDEIRRQLTVDHAPDRIEAVAGIPRTVSGKKLEVPVKRVLKGAAPSDVVSLDSIANPEALGAFVELGRNRAGDRAVTAQEGKSPLAAVEVMARLWARALGLDGVGLYDDFFDLGGTSLRAVGLIARIETELGVRLPLTVFLDGNATVAAMASRVDGYHQAPIDPTVVPIRTTGTGPVLFFVQPDSRAMLAMRHFTRALGPEQSIVGLLPDEPLRWGHGVEATANAMVDSLRAIQPAGPYLLAGFSFGGLVAYQVATELRMSGEDVAWLAVLDVVAPHLARRDPWRYRVRRQRDRGLLDALRRSRVVVRRELRSAAARLDKGPRPPTAMQLTAEYVCAGNDAPMELFVTEERTMFTDSRSLGWEQIHRGVLRVHDVEGVHTTWLLEPEVHVLAAEVARTLRAALKGLRAGQA